MIIINVTFILKNRILYIFFYLTLNVRSECGPRVAMAKGIAVSYRYPVS